MMQLTQILTLLTLGISAWASGIGDTQSTILTGSPTCSSECTASIATYSSFFFTQETSDRYAIPLPTAPPTTTYARPFNVLSTLLPDDVLTTTYSLDISATETVRYGQSAFADLWRSFSYSNTVLPFTTTVEPTPIPTSELVFPPALYQASQNTLSYMEGYCLPKDFIWGVASSAWQVEGASMFEGRGPSQLDEIGALPFGAFQPVIQLGLNDSVIADMHYLYYKQDIARLAAIGIPYYSFSISWTRIVPFGETGSPINQPGLDHYEDVIATCLEYGVTPIVTLLHADPPEHLRFNATSFPEAFLYYAKTVMTRFSDRVPIWVTLNEPNVLITNYAVIPNILMAHAKVYHFYKEELFGTGRLTIKFANNLAVPQDPSNSTHVEAALRYQEFLLGIIGNPLLLGKDYPSSVLSTTGMNLTSLTPTELSYLNDTLDFFSFDPYMTQFALPPPSGISACASNASDPLYPICVQNTNVQSNDWINGDFSFQWAYMTPQYFRQHLSYIWNTFTPPAIMITEFGFNPYSEFSRPLDAQRYDLERTLYYASFLTEMLKAIHDDGINVIGAIAWSALDNNEFGSFEQQYGMQYVDRQTFNRVYKRSMFDYVDFFTSHISK